MAKRTSLIIEKFERAKRAGNFFLLFHCIYDILSEKVRIVRHFHENVGKSRRTKKYE